MIKRLRVAQYILIVTYLLIMLFCSLGSVQMHMDIQYIRAPDNGFDGDMSASLDFDVPMKIVLTAIAVLEMALLHNPTEKKAKWSTALCVVRLIPSALHGVFVLLSAIDKTGMFTANVTAFGYLLLLLCVASLVTHKLQRKQLKLTATEEQ